MRMLARLSVLFMVLALAAGPAFAAPLYRSTGATWTAPASGNPASLRGVLGLLALGASALGITIRKDTATLANKFVTRAGAAAGDYKEGVQGAGGEWEQRTKDAEGSYEQGVQQSIADKRFGRGVSGSAGKYQTNAVNLGAQRYGPGVQNAKDAWARGVEPSMSALKSLQLPPRGPRRSPQNMARANAVAVALGALKTNK